MSVVECLDFAHVHLVMALRVVTLFARMLKAHHKMVVWRAYQPDQLVLCLEHLYVALWVSIP